MTPQEGQVWKYLETGKNYDILSIGQMKIGSSEWVAAVTYQCHITEMIFTRDVETFVKKFERVLL